MYKQELMDNLAKLKSKHLEIAELLKGEKVSYIDIPLHYNIGDQLIYLGTENFLRENNINVIHRAFYNNINKKKIQESDTILLHGGGNIGDLYPRHQKLREKIISKYKNKKIIILPQTIYFESEVEKNKCIKIFKSHPNLYIFSRDKKSFEIAKLLSDKVKLMPDMAHSLHPLIDIREITDIKEQKNILNLRRRDKETRQLSSKVFKKEFDWSDMISLSDLAILKAFLILQTLPILKYKINSHWKKHSLNLFFKAEQYFKIYDEIHTDRLHGFILSLLLGKKTFVYDNAYGKNFTYFDAWIEENTLLEKEIPNQ
ncbi:MULTISPECIES: polysaccharide pyruvyl transferase family protein [unclassified Providencia]|uniref:polysaccharide pyruvyl transferase family protein n=1 Tax=unclassified Providencia TaxID=2633465 RepID=UPI00234AF308|nr:MULTISPECIES: polysaccharide pyruvyl transferase family protein [unclassified Providencia]